MGLFQWRESSPPVFRRVCNVTMVLLPSMNGRRLQLCLCFDPQIDVLKCPSNTEQETSVSECREKMFVGVIFLSFSLRSFCSMEKKKNNSCNKVWGWRLAFSSFFFQKHRISISKRRGNVERDFFLEGWMEDRHHKGTTINANAGDGKCVILWIVQTENNVSSFCFLFTTAVVSLQ